MIDLQLEGFLFFQDYPDQAPPTVLTGRQIFQFIARTADFTAALKGPVSSCDCAYAPLGFA